MPFNTFVLYPHDWLECFQIPIEESKKYRLKVIESVKQREQELAAKREYNVIGAQALRSRAINTSFTPKKFAPRMWCICCDVDLRKTFIAGIKSLRAKARAVYERWRNHAGFQTTRLVDSQKATLPHLEAVADLQHEISRASETRSKAISCLGHCKVGTWAVAAKSQSCRANGALGLVVFFSRLAFVECGILPKTTTEPPGTDPYARWYERSRFVRGGPISILPLINRKYEQSL